jgi:DNA primase
MPFDPEQIKIYITIQDILLDEGIHFRNGRCRCPIHRGNNPTSFSFNGKTYYCFSCGSKGDVIALVQELYGLSFKDAVRYLIEKAGLSLETLEGVRTQELKMKPCSNWDRYFEKQIDHAIVFIEKVWTALLRKLDGQLKRGKIDLAGYYRDRQWLEYSLNELDEFNIARNWQRNQMRKEKYEKRRDEGDFQA